MTIDQKIQDDIKLAMKAGEKDKIETLRMLRAQLKNEKIKIGRNLENDDEISVLSSVVKKLRESIELYKQGNRSDLVEHESRQLEITQHYLPKALTDDQIDDLIQQTITELAVTSIHDTGKIMSVIMPKVKGRADGKLVQQKVRTALSNLT